MIVLRADNRQTCGRRAVAAPETGDALHRHLTIGVGCRQITQHLSGAGEMTCHVAADTQRDGSRGRQCKMWKKTRDGMQPVKGNAGIAGKLLKRFPFEIAVLMLNPLECWNERCHSGNLTTHSDAWPSRGR